MQISLAKVKYLILDEADRMLDMGFLPSMMELVNKMGMPGKSDRQTLMFSATFPEEIQRLACELLGDYIFVTVGRVGGANIDIEQRVILVDQMKKRDQLVSILNEQGLYCFILELIKTQPFLTLLTFLPLIRNRNVNKVRIGCVLIRDAPIMYQLLVSR